MVAWGVWMVKVVMGSGGRLIRNWIVLAAALRLLSLLSFDPFCNGMQIYISPLASPIQLNLTELDLAPAPGADCSPRCAEPFTASPIGSPCGCVLPVKVKLALGIPIYLLFPHMDELEVEIAAGTSLRPSQVWIMGAAADGKNHGRTIVDVNLVPLQDKFDNMTAVLIHDRFLKNEVPLNGTLFGIYEVIQVRYPGFSPIVPPGSGIVSVPIGSPASLPTTSDSSSQNGGLAPSVIVLIVLSAFLVFFFFMGAIIVAIKRREIGGPSHIVGPLFATSISKTSGDGSISSSSMTGSPLLSLMSAINTYMVSIKVFSLSELEEATGNFSSKAVLGFGGFGRVYHGFLEDGSEVAVKLLTRNNQNGDHEFAAEVEMLSRLHHRNLVKLIGICAERNRRLFVFELVRNGSVESHLHGADRLRGPLDWCARMKIALGAARGLAYLHEESNPPVIHRDFKASNILLQGDFTPKVSDFGMAREATEGKEHISTRVMGTFGYVAPEYAMTGHLLFKSDVYSYGVVLLELLTGRKPVDMSQPQGQENLVTWARPLLTSREGLELLIDPSLQGKVDYDSMAGIASIASRCVHSEVCQRPFMGEVVRALKLIYDDKEDTHEDYCSRIASLSALESDYKEVSYSDSSQQTSSFTTSETYSRSMEVMNNSQRPISISEICSKRPSLSVIQTNGSDALYPNLSELSLFRRSKSDSA